VYLVLQTPGNPNHNPLRDKAKMAKHNLTKAIELVEQIGKRAAQKKKQTEADKTLPDKRLQMSLDLWPERIRGVPNAVLRGALFSVSNNRPTFKKRTLISAVEGLEIRYKGERFNQTDLDLWEMLLHLARLQPLGSKVEFTAHALLKALGRGTGLSQHEQLKEDMARLRSGTVEITWTKEGKTFLGGLIEKAFRDEHTGRYVVVLDEKMRQLYDNGYTHIDWEQRQALGRNNLAKWLQGFYASHAEPFPYKVDTLHNLCGSANPDLRGFKRDLKKSLDQLLQVGAIKAWEIDGDDLVHIRRIPSRSQIKHLNRRKK
jgi:hypothetical protein